MLSVTITRGVIRQAELLADTSKKDSSNLDRSKYKLVQPGDIAYNKMRAWQGAAGASKHRGIVSPAYVVQRLRGDDNPEYFHHLFRTPIFAKEAERWSYGITSDMWSLRPEHFKAIYSPLPPPAEQAAIVRFLGAVDRKVNRFIRAKRRLIEVLTEQKQAIITHAVTKGLSPSAPGTRFKLTGKVWVPEVPAGWSAVTLRRVITRAVDGPHHSPTYVDQGVMFISARNVKVDEWSLADAKYISQADYEEFSRRIKPEVGDVLYTKGGTTGVARAVDLDFPFQVWVHIAVLKLRRGVITPAYLSLALNSTPCYQQAQLYTRGATNQDLGLGRMKDIELPLPPTLTEQEAIVEYVNKATDAIRCAIADARREIDLIREYRTRLVADVVTGKVDVRGVAADIPDAPNADGADLPDVDEGLPPDPEGEDTALTTEVEEAET
jgi:type I restriction enzyme S subunit